MNAHKTLIVVWGWTGWHAYPLLNLIQYIHNNTVKTSKLFSAISFRWIGEVDSIESRLASSNNIPFSAIICGKLRRYFSFKTLLLPFQVLSGIIQSIIILIDEKPLGIFSKGGYVSLPVAVAGWLLQTPIYLHESDSVPGLANRIVARFATGILCSFAEAEKFFAPEKIMGHGTLLPLGINEILTEPTKENPKTQLLVNCGSQWSSRIFDAILEILETWNPSLSTVDIHLILGTQNAHYRKKFKQFQQVKLYDFFYDQKEYFELVHNCDIVIARSGSSIFEFEALGLHMILIPHPHTGGNHQYYNAKIFEKKGHECILQENLSKELPIVLEKYKGYKKPFKTEPLDMSIYALLEKKLLK